MECPRIAQKTRPTFLLTPAEGHRPLFVVLVVLCADPLEKRSVALKAIAVNYWRLGSQNGNPG